MTEPNSIGLGVILPKVDAKTQRLLKGFFSSVIYGLISKYPDISFEECEKDIDGNEQIKFRVIIE